MLFRKLILDSCIILLEFLKDNIGLLITTFLFAFNETIFLEMSTIGLSFEPTRKYNSNYEK